MSRCLICGGFYHQGRALTCSESCHEELINRLTARFGEFKEVVRSSTGEVFKVPTKDILEKGVREQDLDRYPRLVRLGECNRCGKCCDPATLPRRMEVYRRYGLAVLIHTEPCPHFHYDGRGVCDIYKERPAMCRAFPRRPADIEGLPECSYRFIWIKGGSNGTDES